VNKFMFISPGFPIYKANIVPFLEDGQRIHLREMTEQVVEKWGRALLSMKEFVGRVYLYAKPVVEKLSEEEKRYRTYELIGDAITAYLRVPLLRDPLMGLVPSPLIYYAAARFYYPESRRLLQCDPVSFIQKIEKVAKILHDEIRELSGSEIENLWFSLPADTRPLYNTSGLIPHLLLTSALSWGRAVNDGLSREEAAKLRVAAIFHDISKPFNFERHYELAPDLLEEVLGDVIDRYAVEELKNYAAHHHAYAETTQSRIIKKADSLASSSDRLSNLCEKLVYPRLERALRGVDMDPKIGYGSGKEAWDFWRKLEQLEPGYIQAISEKVAYDLLKLQEDVKRELSEKPRGDGADGDLRLALIDLGSIQEFISRTRDLRSVSASSLVVDSVTLAHLPLLIQSVLDEEGYWVPLESFLVMSGGSLTLLLPNIVVNRLHALWRDRIAQLLEEIGLTVYLASTDFTGNYYIDSGRLAEQMLREKLTYEPRITRIENVNIKEFSPDFCELCYSSPRIADGRYCSLCNRLHELGNDIHFKNRWREGFRLGDKKIIPADSFNKKYEDIGDIMYIIAGQPEATLGLDERKRNLAVIKLDGNLMGAFFAESLSLSDALERSARVDMALKSALEKAATDLYSGVTQSSYSQPSDPEKAVSSLFLGLIYAGGDDALIVCPSWCALPLAYSISQYFYMELGGERALSAGIAAAPPEHDIWALIDAAAKLLDMAKDKIGRGSPDVGGIAFDYIEGGVLSGSSVRARLLTAYSEGVAVQPLSLSDRGGQFSLGGLLRALRLPTEMRELFSLAFTASRKEENNRDHRRLKNLRSAVIESIGVSKSVMNGAERSRVLVLHVNRMRNTKPSDDRSHKGDERDESYEILADLLRLSLVNSVNKTRIAFPLLEVNFIIKFLGGGAI